MKIVFRHGWMSRRGGLEPSVLVRHGHEVISQALSDIDFEALIVKATFPLKCSPQDSDKFIDASKPHAAGWISFYWGKSPDELRQSKGIAEAITLEWWEIFEMRATSMAR